MRNHSHLNDASRDYDIHHPDIDVTTLSHQIIERGRLLRSAHPLSSRKTAEVCAGNDNDGDKQHFGRARGSGRSGASRRVLSVNRLTAQVVASTIRTRDGRLFDPFCRNRTPSLLGVKKFRHPGLSSLKPNGLEYRSLGATPEMLESGRLTSIVSTAFNCFAAIDAFASFARPRRSNDGDDEEEYGQGGVIDLGGEQMMHAEAATVSGE